MEYWNIQMTVQEVDQTNKIIDIRAMNICVINTAVEVEPSEKTFKENLYRGGGVLTLGAPLLIRLYECLSLALATSIQPQNTTISDYMDNNNLYQGLIQTKQ